MKVTKIIDIKFTYNCNNRCYLCCQDEEYKNKKSNINLKDFSYILDMDNNRKATKIVISGGEATIHTEFLYLMKAIHEYGYENIQLQTNARTLSDEKFLEQIISNGVNNFGISLHGSIPEIHNQFSITDSFDQVITALRNLRKYNSNIYVAVNSVIFDKNINDLINISELLHKENLCNSHQLAYIHIIGKAKDKLNSILKISDVAKVVRPILEKSKDYNMKMYTEAFPFCLLAGYEKHASELYVGKCEIITIDYEKRQNYSELKNDSLKSKMSCCKNCLFDSICEGVWSEYIDYFGDIEFKARRSMQT